MNILTLVSHLLVLSLLLQRSEGKSILEHIMKRSAALVTFNGQRVIPGTNRFQSVPNYSMSNTAGAAAATTTTTQRVGMAGTVVTDFNSTQPQNLTPVTQVAPANTLATHNQQQVLPLNYGSQAFPQAVLPTYGSGTVGVGTVPQFVVPGFNTAQVLPIHSHTPLQVASSLNLNPGLVLSNRNPLQVLPQVGLLPSHSHTPLQVASTLNLNPGLVLSNQNPLQVLPQVLPQVPAHIHTPFQGVPNNFYNTPILDPGFFPRFGPVQVPPHSHTPAQVAPHFHQPAQNPNPGLVIVQVPVPQLIQTNASTVPDPIRRTGPTQPARDNTNIINLLGLLNRRQTPNTIQTPNTVQVVVDGLAGFGGGGGSSSNGGRSD